MSVTMSRFVNVMTGGRVKKDWDHKAVSRTDAKLGSVLQELDTVLDSVTALGAVLDPAWAKRREDLVRDMTTVPAVKGAKAVDYIDGVYKSARKAVAEAKLYAADVTNKINERKALIDEVRKKLQEAEGSFIHDYPNQKVLARNTVILDSIKDGLEFCARNADYSLEQQKTVISELRDMEKLLSSFGKSWSYGMSVDASLAIDDYQKNARENLDGDSGKMVAALDLENPRTVNLRLLRIQGLRDKYGTDFRPLDLTDLLAIFTYTTMDGDYVKMHELLLGKIPENPNIRAKIDCCVKALNKLPDYPHTAMPLYRMEDGGKYDWQRQFATGKTFETKIFWSAGKGGGVNTQGTMKGPVLNIIIFGKHGKDVAKTSAVQGEGGGEVLFKPGSKFRTIDIDDPDGATFKKFEKPTAAAPADAPLPNIYITVEEV